MGHRDVEKPPFALIVASYRGVAEDVTVESEISLLNRAGISRKQFTRLAVAVSQKIIPYNVFRWIKNGRL